LATLWHWKHEKLLIQLIGVNPEKEEAYVGAELSVDRVFLLVADHVAEPGDKI
jgi:hypothetical protein